MLADELTNRRGRERPLARVEFVQNQTEREDIARRAHVPAEQLLRRHVCGCPGPGVVDLTNGGQPEVHDAHRTAGVEHQVCWLQIPVNDALAVRRGKTRTELSRDVGGAVLGESTDPAEG